MPLRFRAMCWILVALAARVDSADAGFLAGISYQDLPIGTSTNLTEAGSLDWVKWSNGGASGVTNYSTPEMTGGSIINSSLIPLGAVPSGQNVVLVQFVPSPERTILSFNWSNGNEAPAGGGPVGSVVSEAINPAQVSYPLGLGASFTAQASEELRQLNLYVQGFNTRMLLSASLSGGGGGSLLATQALLTPVADGVNALNYYSVGIFSVTYSGAGETLTINLIADNQSGVPGDATQFVFRNAGVFAATVVPGQIVPEPSSLLSTVIGLAGSAGFWRTISQRRSRIRERTG